MKRTAGLVLASILCVGFAPTASATPGGGPWESVRDPGIVILNPRIWVLQGERLESGVCRYHFADVPAALPGAGWARMSVAVNHSTCRKLMQEGVPADPVAASIAAEVSTKQVDMAGLDTETAAVTSRRGAWQRVIWFDLANIALTSDLTQIYWSYNGSTVSNGTTSGSCDTHVAWWSRDYCYKSDSYPSGAYLGNTWSKFRTSFCVGLPTTYTYYYYNKLWGHPNGTATRAESSDSVDECLPLHSSLFSGYN